MLAVNGCADSGDESAALERPDGRYVTRAQAMAIAQAENSTIVRGGDRAYIREVLSDVQVDFAAGTGSGVCNELSEQGEREIERAGTGHRRSCDSVVTKMARRNQRQGLKGKLSAIWSIDIAGDRASALVKDPGDRSPYRVRFVKQNGQLWTLVSLADVEPFVGVAP